MDEYTYPKRIHGKPEDEKGALTYHHVQIHLTEDVDEEGILDPEPKTILADIIFQNGTIPEVGRNGVTMEEVIGVLVTRLEDYQETPFKCRENALAITKLQEALHWLGHRTADRIERGVEGTNKQ